MFEKMDYQWFGGGDGGAQSGDSAAGDNPGGDGQAADDRGDAGTQPEPEERTFTQEEVNKMMASTKGEITKKMLEELGVEDVKSGKEAIKQFEEWKKNQMSKEEALAAEKAELEKKYQETARARTEDQAKLAALKLGVDDSYIQDVVKLLPEGEGSIEDRMKEFLAERPLYLKKKADNVGGKSNEGSMSSEESAIQRMRDLTKR